MILIAAVVAWFLFVVFVAILCRIAADADALGRFAARRSSRSREIPRSVRPADSVAREDSSEVAVGDPRATVPDV